MPKDYISNVRMGFLTSVVRVLVEGDVLERRSFKYIDRDWPISYIFNNNNT